MSLNSTPSGERIQIGFFGRRNSGKSSLVNAVTGQDLSVVSDVKGTTTDPVTKAMELLPLGPVSIIDTPGFDDEGTLGELRIEKTKQILRKTDIAILVTDAQQALNTTDSELISIFNNLGIKYIIVYNKCDKITGLKPLKDNEIYTSALYNKNINELKELIASVYGENENSRALVKDLVKPNDFVILVAPQDKAAPKGRLILPQQQVIRDLLDAGAITTVVRELEYENALAASPKKPQLVITDSQVFEKISAQTPEDILLTSFSILFARYKGILDTAVRSVKALDNIEDNDKILISEGCTHHRQCNDIGTVKLPALIKKYTGKSPEFEFSSGTGFPKDLSNFKLIIHCGACMLNQKEVLFRYNCAKKQNIPVTNYGTAIAYMHGILTRTVKPFDDIYHELIKY